MRRSACINSVARIAEKRRAALLRARGLENNPAAMSQARRAALHLLNNDWSRAVWKHWLSNIFLPPVEPPQPAPSSAPAVEQSVNTAPANDLAQARLSSTCSERPSDTPDSSGRDARRNELRARFDALSERMGAVEDGLETLLRRSSQREKSERRSDQLNSEAIDQMALAAERQAAVLEGMLGTVSRLEHALSRLEHGLSRVERALGERNRRDSHFPSAAPPPPSTRATSDVEEIDPNESSSINGFLSEVSLSTVLAMLEIERHTGRLKVATDDGKLASFELTEGSVISSRLLENDADPLQTLRTALCWKQGRFWFRQQPAEAPSYPPRSIGSLLLEATRQNDESFANVG